ncbi:MAG: glutamate formimidoyltransferase [Terriglobales bacterium]
MRLIECVPNFSEGRDPGVVNALVEAMLAVPGVYLLDREMDADHHRAVVTLAGDPQAVAEAAVRGVGEAVRRIDLRQHHGAHPRVGAADVVPFVPLQGVTLDECIALAGWTGEEIWRRFRVPVYFYEAAARRPERRGLETLRKGQFEGLLEQVRTDPGRRPDIGDAALHPSAGATIVGARKFLIAYNINLDTAELEVARQIAKTIRTSSGGMPAVKAMGVMLSNPPRAQVSMNLTDFETTSLAAVWREVGEQAAQRGAKVVESELIGLAPRAALEGVAAELLRFTEFNSQRVVENRVASVMASRPARFAGSLQPFLEALASDAPAPGGGSAAAAAGAMAAALGRMVARLAKAKAAKAQPDQAPAGLWTEAGDEFAALGEALARAVDEDSEAYLAIRAAFRLPKATPDEQKSRRAAIGAATVVAAEVPLGVAVRCQRLLMRLRQLQPLIPAAMASDLTTASALAQAGAIGARDNVVINLESLPADSPERRRLTTELDRLAAANEC